jgi:hypothetical protein
MFSSELTTKAQIPAALSIFCNASPPDPGLVTEEHARRLPIMVPFISCICACCISNPCRQNHHAGWTFDPQSVRWAPAGSLPSAGSLCRDRDHSCRHRDRKMPSAGVVIPGSTLLQADSALMIPRALRRGQSLQHALANPKQGVTDN